MGFAQEVELVEMGNLLAGDGALVGEVEVVEGLDLGEPGCSDPVLAAVLEDLAEQRQATGKELSVHIRALGDLPDALDVDRESLSRMGALIKASVSDDPHALCETLARQAARLERGIVEQAERSLSTPITGSVRSSVQRLRDSARAGVRRLEC